MFIRRCPKVRLSAVMLTCLRRDDYTGQRSVQAHFNTDANTPGTGVFRLLWDVERV